MVDIIFLTLGSHQDLPLKSSNETNVHTFSPIQDIEINPLSGQITSSISTTTAIHSFGKQPIKFIVFGTREF